MLYILRKYFKSKSINVTMSAIKNGILDELRKWCLSLKVDQDFEKKKNFFSEWQKTFWGRANFGG